VTTNEEVKGVPLWYFLNHDEAPNLKGALKNVLFRREELDGEPKAATTKGIIFEATRDIKAGEQMFHKYTKEALEFGDESC
jgi:SET domain-containing protein